MTHSSILKFLLKKISFRKKWLHREVVRTLSWMAILLWGVTSCQLIYFASVPAHQGSLWEGNTENMTGWGIHRRHKISGTVQQVGEGLKGYGGPEQMSPTCLATSWTQPWRCPMSPAFQQARCGDAGWDSKSTQGEHLMPHWAMGPQRAPDVTLSIGTETVLKLQQPGNSHSLPCKGAVVWLWTECVPQKAWTGGLVHSMVVSRWGSMCHLPWSPRQSRRQDVCTWSLQNWELCKGLSLPSYTAPDILWQPWKTH